MVKMARAAPREIDRETVLASIAPAPRIAAVVPPNGREDDGR